MEEVHEKVDKIKINQNGGLREKCKVEEEQGGKEEQGRCWDESGGQEEEGTGVIFHSLAVCLAMSASGRAEDYGIMVSVDGHVSHHGRN